MGKNWKTLEALMDGLSEEEFGRVLAKIKGFTYGRALDHWEYMALQPKAPERVRSREEVAALAAHAEAYAVLAAARGRFEDAVAELRKAERKMGPEDATGLQRRTPAQEAEVVRLAAVVEECEADVNDALANEVAKRPHQPAKRRERVPFALGGIFRGKTSDYGPEAEVRR